MSVSGYLSHWYDALAETFGIVLVSDNRQALAQRLYAARREACDPDLDSISIVTSPTADNELWLVRRKPR